MNGYGLYLNFTKKWDDNCKNTVKLKSVSCIIKDLEVEHLKFRLLHGTASERVKGHLCYKIGDMVLNNCFGPLAPIKIFYKFIWLALQFKIQKFLNRENKSNMRLEKYPDYIDALSIMKQVNYQSGKLLLAWSRNWYRKSLFSCISKIRENVQLYMKDKDLEECLYGDSLPRPYMSEKERIFLKACLKNSRKYFEFGSGGSTFYALVYSNALIFSLEADSEWVEKMLEYDLIKKSIGNRLKFYLVDIGKTKKWSYPVNNEFKTAYPMYSRGLLDVIGGGDDIDLILVDGRFRVACVLQAILYCRQDVKILIHDFTCREYYFVVKNFLDIVYECETLVLFKKKDVIDRSEVLRLYEEYKYVLL